MAHIYDNKSDFWTSDDDEVDNDEIEDINNNSSSDSINPQDDTVGDQLIVAGDIEDVCDTVAKCSMQNGTTTLTSDTDLIIELPKTSRKHIRKKWVVEDNSNVSSMPWSELLPDPAMTFPFELDDFQKRAILHLSRNEYTFVAAHTSAGKTVVAEYAIAQACQIGRRAIYTSPIKALSNQKYRDFKTKFDSVGIITGDVSIEPNATCLIVTTEILRTMLYRDDPTLSLLEVVIFDEVHYVNDAERGVVWEEVIIMLKNSVNMVMLSATVPNYIEFADWIGRTKKREVFAICTHHRPTPLRHYLWINDTTFLLMDRNNKFNDRVYNQMYQSIREKDKEKQLKLQTAAAKAKGKAKAVKVIAKPQTQQKTEAAKIKTEIHRLQTLLQKLRADSHLPVVVFCFSRYKCEVFSTHMPKLDFVDHEERSKIHVFINEAFSSLCEADRNVPQVSVITQLALRGVGVHHSGLLPIIKEVVEILFQRGLVKVLFATETFSMGVNMPARSVVFSSLQKHDGQSFRYLLPSEYTQMAGRAGRRGLDEFGQCYIFCPHEPPDQRSLIQIMVQKAHPLRSQFRLTFHTMLQLSKRQFLLLEDMLALSFREALRAQLLPVYKRDIKRYTKELDSIPAVECIFGEPTIDRYCADDEDSRYVASKLHVGLFNNKLSREVFCPGRVLVLHSLPFIIGTAHAVLYSVDNTTQGSSEFPNLTVLVLIPANTKYGQMPASEYIKIQSQAQNKRKVLPHLVTSTTLGNKGDDKNCIILRSGDVIRGGEVYRYYAMCSEVSLQCVGTICDKVLKRPSNEFSVEDEFLSYSLVEELQGFVSVEGTLRPYVLTKKFKQLEIEFFHDLLTQRDISARLNGNKCHTCVIREQHLEATLETRQLSAYIDEINRYLKKGSLDLYDEMLMKKEFLKIHGLTDTNGCITLKGRVACEVTTTDELTLTEALFDNILHDKLPEEAAAILSFFVFPEKSKDEPMGPTAAIAEARTQLEMTHAKLERAMRSVNLRVDSKQWWSLCNPGLCLVAYQWANGVQFGEMMEHTNLQEGTIVRGIQRLAELIRKVKDAAQLMGDVKLKKLMEETEIRVKRDIIFMPSLYLQK